MIILSTFTKDFFRELIQEETNEKILRHFNDVIKRDNFFFIGNKKLLMEIIKKNKNKIQNNQKKYYLIEKIFKRSGWIDIRLNSDNIQQLFKYLNKKMVQLDFIYSSNKERMKKTGEIKTLKKKTLDIVISPNRIISNESTIIKKYNKKNAVKYKINYDPSEKFERVKNKPEFVSWLREITKIIFVCDKIFIYDRYIASKLKDDKYNSRHFQSETYFNTLKYISNIIENSFWKNTFSCEILSILEPDFGNKSKKTSKIDKLNVEAWEFFIGEVKNYLNCLKKINRKIIIKDWQLWNHIHDRYWRFYYGGNIIKVLKFNPGFNFILEINRDRMRPKKYEFDSVDREVVFRDNSEFQSLVENKSTAYLLEKAS